MTSITIKEYYAERGSRYSNKDAERIGPELHSLSENGAVTPRDVVDAARSTNSPLHEFFEWNDKKAADLFRVEQARNMLRSINVRYIEGGQPKEARAFQVTRTGAYEGEPRKYRSFDVLYGDSAFAASMMDAAIDDLRSWKRKYQPYTEMWIKFGDCFQGVVNQISEFEEEYKAQNIASETDVALLALLKWREDCADVLASWTACREQVEFIMEAIGKAEEAAGKLGPRERDCMRCHKPFKSHGSGHRICPTCSRSIATTGGGLDETAIGDLA